MASATAIPGTVGDDDYALVPTLPAVSLSNPSQAFQFSSSTATSFLVFLLALARKVGQT
jgi:hypothetical protein